MECQLRRQTWYYYLGRIECTMCIMRPIATMIPQRGVCQSVTRLCCAKTAERIKVLCGAVTLGDKRLCSIRAW